MPIKSEVPLSVVPNFSQAYATRVAPYTLLEIKGVSPPSTGTLDVSDLYNIIEYDNGRGFNMCEHTYYKVKGSEEGVSTRFAVVYKAGSTCGYYIAEWAHPNTLSVPASAVNPPLEEIWREEAWQHIYPRLNDGFSMANFLLELRDFSSLFKMSKRLSQQVSNLSRTISKQGISSFGSKTAAELLLTYSFAILPMKSDLEKIYDLLSDTNKQINEFIERGKKPNNYHFTKVISDSTTDADSIFGHTETVLRTVYHATARLSYQYKKPSQIEGFLRVWGLRPTAEVIWNAIPFTFVIDWVLKVSDFLSQLDVDPNVTVRVHDYCDSLKTTSSMTEYRSDRATYLHQFDDPSYSNVEWEGLDDQAVWTLEKVHYQRWPDTPATGYAFPVSDSLSGRELVLGGALLRVLSN